jgi:hypothetical protein
MSSYHKFKLLILQAFIFLDSKRIPKKLITYKSTSRLRGRANAALRVWGVFVLLRDMTVKGRCPRPLDERDEAYMVAISNFPG